MTVAGRGMRAIVVGAGHNGLVCACYLAQAGLDVLVLEQADRPGGGSRTDETVPGYRFDTHVAVRGRVSGLPGRAAAGVVLQDAARLGRL